MLSYPLSRRTESFWTCLAVACLVASLAVVLPGHASPLWRFEVAGCLALVGALATWVRSRLNDQLELDVTERRLRVVRTGPGPARTLTTCSLDDVAEVALPARASSVLLLLSGGRVLELVCKDETGAEVAARSFAVALRRLVRRDVSLAASSPVQRNGAWSFRPVRVEPQQLGRASSF